MDLGILKDTLQEIAGPSKYRKLQEELWYALPSGNYHVICLIIWDRVVIRRSDRNFRIRIAIRDCIWAGGGYGL